jgi:hypothetical protein
VKQKQQQKLWEKQERKLREMKSKGVSKENAEKAQLKAKAREPGMLCRIKQHQNQYQHTSDQTSSFVAFTSKRHHHYSTPRRYCSTSLGLLLYSSFSFFMLILYSSSPLPLHLFFSFLDCCQVRGRRRQKLQLPRQEVWRAGRARWS